MVKGINDKQTGFWMFLKHIRPELEQKLGEQIKTADLIRFGQPYWAKLNYEVKEEWNEKAKKYNKSARLNRLLEPVDFARPCASQKLKPSKIIPPSRRYDEVDQYSRKYFAEVDDDFEGKRENDRREFIDHYQWKFARKVVTANVYYEDSSKKQMIPSEISILKFSIKRGIYDHRHYILGFAESGIIFEDCKTEAEENEQITGLLMNSDRMTANVRFDYAHIWDEIKTFTKIDGDGVKLLLLSNCWNTVVGSFDALFVYANEKSFSRIETRFATLEDYFMAVYATVNDVPISDEIKSDIAIEMNEPWYRTVFFDSVTCDFHADLKYTKECQAKSCSLFAAHKAAFSFFALCKKHVFPDFEFTEQHMPKKASLSTIGNIFLECTSQQSSIHAADYTSVENIPERSSISLLSPKKKTLKSNVRKGTVSVCEVGGTEQDAVALERKTRPIYNTFFDDKVDELGNMTNQTGFCYDVEKWLQTQRPMQHADRWEMRVCSRNPQISAASSVDKHCAAVDAVIDQQLISLSQFTSVPSCRSSQKIPAYPSEKSRSNFSGIHAIESQLPLNYQSSTSDKGFSNVVINNDVGRKDDILFDRSRIDNDSDTEMFYDISIPTSSLYRQDSLIPAPQVLTPGMSKDYQNSLFLKMSSEISQIPSLLSEEIGTTHDVVKNVQNTYHNQPVATSNAYPVSSKSSKIFFSKVSQDKLVPSKGESMECSLDLSFYPQKVLKSSLSNDNLIPERTSGGFCIPNICQTNYLCMSENRIANQTVAPKNPHTSNQNLTRNEQKERKFEASARMQHQSSPNPIQSLVVNNTVGYKCRSQKANVMKPLILEPLICKEADIFGWSENVQNNNPGQKFAQWLNSVYFESEIPNNNKEIFLKIESDYGKAS
ncbi:unnamed protein product [Onchocerca ochengi]|uniref:Maelstrom domain-containing protein n=3 Tax=Onchocerca ochengi TaxID=42157 RepID=A0A182E3A8_ONCOC|nr:unnamed protein product [Onchocerca ochengi]